VVVWALAVVAIVAIVTAIAAASAARVVRTRAARACRTIRTSVVMLPSIPKYIVQLSPFDRAGVRVTPPVVRLAAGALDVGQCRTIAE
jgi:hypothetical protein